MIKYRVYLTDTERSELKMMVSKGKRKATDIQKAMCCWQVMKRLKD